MTENDRATVLKLPEEYFGEFQQLIDLQMKRIEDRVDTDTRAYANQIKQLITDSHNRLAIGINHLSDVTESSLMDLKYITKPRTVYQAGDFSSCMFVEDIISLALMEGIMRQRSSLSTTGVMNTKYGLISDDIDPRGWYLRCDRAHCNLHNLIHEQISFTPLQEGGDARYQDKRVFVLACMYHHFEIENMNYVTITMRMSVKARKLVKYGSIDAEEVHEMFFYELQNGMI